MAQNDPQWGGGKRGNDGPPDLDEIFRKLNQKISRLLGGGSGGAKPPGSRGSGSRRAFGGAVVLLGILGALWLASGFYIVDAREQGVVLQLGRYNRTTDAGLQWHLPYPFEKVQLVNLTEVRSVEIGYRGNAKNKVPEESLMLTADQNIIDVQFSVQYDIKDAKAFLFNNVFTDPDGKDAVKAVAESAIREIVGRNKVDFVLNEGRGQIAADTQVLIQRILDSYGTGIHITKVNINDVQPPEQVIAAFDDATKAGQDKDRLRNDGLAYSNDVVPKARGMAARLLEESEGYRQKVADNARGDASRFTQILAQYTQAPAVMRDRLYYDMMQQILTNTSKVLVDQKNGGNNLLYLPLDKLMQQSGTSRPSTSSEDTAPQASTPATASVAPSTIESGSTQDPARDPVRTGRSGRDDGGAR